MNPLLVILVFLLSCQFSMASDIGDTVKVFKNAGKSASFFNNSYGYAVFPMIAKAGMGLGGAYGKGQVYKQGEHAGYSNMTQISIGFQLGAQGYSQIVFFQDWRAYTEFTNGTFEFSATAQAVAITAGASISAGTLGSSMSASGGQNNAETEGGYNKGMAIFTIAKGGLMYEASIAGQKFKYTAK